MLFPISDTDISTSRRARELVIILCVNVVIVILSAWLASLQLSSLAIEERSILLLACRQVGGRTLAL